MENITQEFDTQEMFNLLFRLITTEEAIEMFPAEDYSKLFLYLILLKEELD